MGYVRQGGRTLIFDDLFPQFNPSWRRANQVQPRAPRRWGHDAAAAQRAQRGDLKQVCSDIGIQFPSEGILWDTIIAPKAESAPREILFHRRDRFNQS